MRNEVITVVLSSSRKAGHETEINEVTMNGRTLIGVHGDFQMKQLSVTGSTPRRTLP